MAYVYGLERPTVYPMTKSGIIVGVYAIGKCATLAQANADPGAGVKLNDIAAY